MVKRNVIATKLTKICTQTQKRAFDVAVRDLVQPEPNLETQSGTTGIVGLVVGPSG